MVNLKGKTIVDVQEMGGILYQIVGEQTEELLGDKEKIELLGLENLDTNALNIELINLNMFILIKQFTQWESDEEIFTKALDRMHFLLFHQLREDLNYDSDDIEALHEHMFNRYSEYGNLVQLNKNNNWQTEVGRAFLENLDCASQDTEALNMMGEIIDYNNKNILKVLNEYIIEE